MFVINFAVSSMLHTNENKKKQSLTVQGAVPAKPAHIL